MTLSLPRDRDTWRLVSSCKDMSFVLLGFAGICSTPFSAFVAGWIENDSLWFNSFYFLTIILPSMWDRSFPNQISNLRPLQWSVVS